MAQMLCAAFLFLLQRGEVCAVLIINLFCLTFIAYIFFSVFSRGDK